MYTLLECGLFIRDTRRVDAYAAALRRAVTPDSVVVDIGTGTGIFALLACKFGARRVYAIEPGGVIQVACEIAAANGYARRIEFIQRPSTEVALPEPADVIVSDLRDVLPLFRHHLPSIAHARGHFLTRGGRLIPRRDTLWVALAHAPEFYGRYVAPWDGNDYGLDMRAGRRLAVSRWRKGRVARGQLLVEPRCWATLDYSTVQGSDVRGAATWTMGRAGISHALSVWFDTTLGEGVAFSNAPGQPELIYGQALFPLAEPVYLAPGDTVSVALEARLIGGDYVWRWNTRVLRHGEPGATNTDFEQSTAPAVALSGGAPRWDIGRAPALTETGELDRLILTLMDDATPLGDIARQAQRRYPTRFSTWRDALTYVGEVSDQYSREPADRG